MAGAMLCAQYGLFTRMLMKLVARKNGTRLDSTKDQVFTDWAALDHFVEGFVVSLGMAPARSETALAQSDAGVTVEAAALPGS